VLMWLGYSATGTIGGAIGFGILTWVGFLLILAASRPGRRPYVILGLGLALKYLLLKELKCVSTRLALLPYSELL